MNKLAGSSVETLQTYFHLFNEIGIINQLSSTRAGRALPHGLTMSQFSVLNHFTRVRPEASPLQLANAFQVTKGAMTNTLKQLEAKDFVEIKPHETDGRSKLVAISENGRRAHRESQQAMLGAMIDFVSEFSEAEIGQIIPVLERIRIWLDENR